MSWLFGGGNKKKEKSYKANNFSGSTPTYETGRNIDSISVCLLNRLHDPAKSVTKETKMAILKIGFKEPLLILSKGLKMMVKLRSKKVHKVLIMNTLRQLVETYEKETSKGLKIPDDLSENLIRYCISELVSERSISSFWQNSAEMLLISLCKYKPKISSKQLMKHFESNKVPHYFVMKSLGDYSEKFPSLFFPAVKEVLAKSLPLLTSIKKSNNKWVFAASLGKFAKNILLEKDNKKDKVRVEEFAGQFNTTVRHLLNFWIRDREKKVRLVSCEAIGHMLHLVDQEHVIELIPKLFEVFPLLLKKERDDQYPISHGLRNVIEVVMFHAPEKMEKYLDLLFATIHSSVCATLRNMRYAKRKENAKELMSAFAFLGKSSFYTNQLVNFLSKFYDHKDPMVRVGTVKTLTHAIGLLRSELESFKESFVSSINLMTQKPTLQVNLALVLLVEMMGQSGYLSAQGGSNLVNIVVRNCAIRQSEIRMFEQRCKKKKMAIPEVNPSAVRDEADRVLNKLISKELSKKMDNILYPFLLEDYVKVEYAGAMSLLCKAIATIAKRKRSDEDFIIDFEKSVNVPQPQYLLARMFVALCKPYERNDSGTNILRAMYCLSPNIRDTLVEAWSKKLPELKKYLDSNNLESYDRDQWSNLVLNLVRESIGAIEEDEWNVQFGEALASQSALYQNDPEFKKNLLSIYGLVIQKTKYKDFVHKAINNIVTITNHVKPEERIGCARGLGQASTAHTDSVLTKLQSIMKAPVSKGGGGGLFSKKKKVVGPVVTHLTKATALLSYGYVCMLTPIGLINSRVEVHVVNNILPVLKASTSQIIQELGLKALDLVAKAVHPQRLKDFKLRSRDEIIKVILQVLKPMPKKKRDFEFFSRLKVLGMEGIVRMITLPPPMSPAVQELVIREAFLLFKINFEKYDDTIVENVHNTLNAVFSATVTRETLDDVVMGLEKYIGSKDIKVRKKSTEAYIFILKEFVSKIKQIRSISPEEKKKRKAKLAAKKKKEEEAKAELEAKKNGKRKKKKDVDDKEKKKEKEKEEEGEEEAEEESNGLSYFGRVIANLIPRITEGDAKVRENSYNCIYLLLRIQYFLTTGKTALPDYIKKFKTIQKLLASKETKTIKQVIKIISSVLSKAIGEGDLVLFIDYLLNTLQDCEIDGARGACVVLNGIIRTRGKELGKLCGKLVLGILKKMQILVKHEKLRKGLLYSIRELSQHHLYIVINTLLDEPVPHSTEVTESIQIISTDKKLRVKMLDYFLDILNNGQLYEEKKSGNFDKEKKPIIFLFPTKRSMTTMHSLFEIFEVQQLQTLVTSYYTKILPSCLLRIGASHFCAGKNPPVPQSIKMLENFLTLIKDDEVLSEMKTKGVWPLLKSKAQFAEGCESLMSIVCEEHPNLIRKLFDFIQPYNTRIHLGHRTAACVIISVLLSNIRKDKEMVQIAINELLRKTGMNENKTVKLIALKGLANIVHHPKDIQKLYVTPCSNALINCIEDKDEDTVLTTMKSIREVFTVAEDSMVSALLINLCIRLKPSFEKENPKIRAASISLFGVMSKFCKGSLGKLLINNVFNVVPTIITHLQDPDDAVKVACKEALQSLVPELASKKLSDVVQKYDDFEDFDNWCEEFAKTFVLEFDDFVSDFVMNTSVFFKSKWDDIIRVSVLIVGYLFFYIGEKKHTYVNLRHTINGFIELSKHKNPVIRLKVAKVLGNLYSC